MSIRKGASLKKRQEHWAQEPILKTFFARSDGSVNYCSFWFLFHLVQFLLALKPLKFCVKIFGIVCLSKKYFVVLVADWNHSLRCVGLYFQSIVDKSIPMQCYKPIMNLWFCFVCEILRQFINGNFIVLMSSICCS